MSTKRTSTTFDTVKTIVCICVLSGFILSTSSYSVNVSADIFEEGQIETVRCQINNSLLNKGNCPQSNEPIEYLEILLTKNLQITKLCAFHSFLNCTLFIQDPNVNSCGCYPEGNNIYIVNVTVTANINTFEGAYIDCYPNCIDNSGNYPFQSTYNGIPLVVLRTTQPPTTTLITTGTTATTSPPENTTAACNSTENCNQSDKCPVWCIIVVAVCVPCGGGGIIIITVIIIKKKKAKTPGNRPCTSPGQDENYEIEKISVTVTSQVVPDGTKPIPINSPGPDGNIGTDITNTTVIMQAGHDGTKQTSNPKHTKTENEENEPSAYL